jgi:hypothetical protein
MPESGIPGLHCTLRTGYGYDRLLSNECVSTTYPSGPRPSSCLRADIHPSIDRGRRNAKSSTGLRWDRPLKEVSWKVLKSSHRNTNSRVLPVGVSSRASGATSIDLLLESIIAIIVAQVAARVGDGTHVEVDPLGVTEVVAVSVALARVEVGRFDVAEVAGFGEGVVLLIAPTLAARVAAALGELVDGLGALDSGAGGEGRGQGREDGGEVHGACGVGG